MIELRAGAPVAFRPNESGRIRWKREDQTVRSNLTNLKCPPKLDCPQAGFRIGEER